MITSQGGSASVITLSYGERGESGELWKEPNQTVEKVKHILHEEAVTAADTVGADFRWLDLGDYPLNMTDATVEQLMSIFQGVKPNIVLTHNPADPFNPNHPVACQMVQKPRLLYHLARELLAHSAILHRLTCTSSNIINLFKVGYESMKNEM